MKGELRAHFLPRTILLAILNVSVLTAYFWNTGT